MFPKHGLTLRDVCASIQACEKHNPKITNQEWRSDGNCTLAGFESRHLHFQTEVQRQSALPARLDARTTLSLQPGLCRLRQDSIPRRDSEKKYDAGTGF